ncbi:hypothetical protein [Streptomyces sp. NPDC020681]|uniref:hypothetical protein n=1 Tax=Streptomyces sp. NPDC020681 TaxID=3365083 RepID=UPI00378BAF65
MSRPRPQQTSGTVLTLIQEDAELPPITTPLRRFLKHRRLMHHNRLVALVIVVNLAYALHNLTHDGIATDTLAHAALTNFAIAILIRQQYVINLLFRIASGAPTRWPLKVRWTLGKVYHYGGLHIGGAIAGTAWSLALTGVLAHNAERVGTGTFTVSCALVVVLVFMVVTALPPLRARLHDLFERTHRFGGWTALVLVWIQTALNVSVPSLCVLGVLTVSIALPWLRLRRVPVTVERPSSHVALVHFDYGLTPWAGSATTMSRSPLFEWHSFANLPPVGGSGFRLAVSRAGDWTGSFIDDAPSHVWVRGVPTAGVARIESLFKGVVYVATGSGIGPCMYHLLNAEVPARLVWVARSPRATFGDAFVDEILRAHPDATVWDTSWQGKPDIVRLAYAAYRSIDAEAVICISNKTFTWQVVEGLERRGIPAYGAIWDS